MDEIVSHFNNYDNIIFLNTMTTGFGITNRWKVRIYGELRVKVKRWGQKHCDLNTAGRDMSLPKKIETTASLTGSTESSTCAQARPTGIRLDDMSETSALQRSGKQTHIKRIKTLKGCISEEEIDTEKYSPPSSWRGSASKTSSTSRNRSWPCAPYFNSGKDCDNGNLRNYWLETSNAHLPQCNRFRWQSPHTLSVVDTDWTCLPYTQAKAKSNKWIKIPNVISM